MNAHSLYARFLFLLFFAVAGCGPEMVEPTVVRFHVYSDAPLSTVRATLLDEAGNTTEEVFERPIQTTDPAPGQAALALTMAVELSEQSLNKVSAGVMLEGFRDGTDATVRTTVRANFVLRETVFVRVLLSEACVGKACEQGKSCDPFQRASCMDNDLILETARWTKTEDGVLPWTPDAYPYCGRPDAYCPPGCSAASDIDCPRCEDTSTADNCGACGNVCSKVNAFPVCSQGKCMPFCAENYGDCNAAGIANDGCETDLANDLTHCGSCNGPGSNCNYLCEGSRCRGDLYPGVPQSTPLVSASGNPSFIYMRRVVGTSDKLLAVGVNVRSEEAGTVVLFVANDDTGKPGNVLAARSVQLKVSSNGADGALHGPEFVFPAPIIIGLKTVWLGLQTSEQQDVAYWFVEDPLATSVGVSKPVEVGSPPYDPTTVTGDPTNMKRIPYLYGIYK